MAVGAEIEMIPVRADTGDRILARGTRPSGEEFVRAMADQYGWSEEVMGVDPSCWSFQDGRVTFEPGGQIEFSSAVFPTASTLIDAFDQWIPRFTAAASRLGLTLNTIGIEDSVSVCDVPLQLQRDRYRRMSSYFESLGPFGVMMMRQTASLQINVDRGDAPTERWRLLNSLAPYLTAIFANSPRYERRDTGHKSYRAHVWRNLDPRRTGIIYERGKEAERYLNFALDAPALLMTGETFPTFRELVARGDVTKDDWDVHLSTLFPEIRPRDYFEIRSIDSIAPEHVCAAIAFVTGIVYNRKSASAAASLIGDPDSQLLVLAGERGLKSTRLRQAAGELARISMEGCEALGTSYLTGHHLQRAGEFFSSYTFCGRSPADDCSG